MKITVSIPESLFEDVESVAKDLGVSRSRLTRTALQDFLRRRRDEEITAALNRSWAAHPMKSTLSCRISFTRG
jgi:metal-responsive CopG/Arc/MetJ family transcriptional regulator